MQLNQLASPLPNVGVYLWTGAHRANSPLLVSVAALRRVLDDAPTGVEWLAVVDERDADVANLVRLAVAGSADAAAHGRELSEAVKYVDDDGFVIGTADRSRLVTLVGPEVVRRAALVSGLVDFDDTDFVNVTAVAAASGRVVVAAKAPG